jgi:hypothetical protein
MRKFHRFGHHDQGQPTAFRTLGLLIATIVFATLVAWSTTSAHTTSQNTLATNQSFSVALPLVIWLEPGELLQAPTPPVIDTTATPTATALASLTPTNSPDCDLEIEQNLVGRLRAPNTGEVTNSSASCAYAVGFASYRMFDDNLSHQQLFSSQTALIGPGQTLTFTIELPACAYQVDLFYGPLIEKFDPQHGQAYGKRILTSRVIHNPGFCVPSTTTPTSMATPNATPTGSPTPTETASPTPSVIGT